VTAAAPLLAFDGVGKIYGEGGGQVRALTGVDLAIGRGEFVAIMGPSGSGKSTAMNILGCLDSPSRGTYRFASVDVTGLSRDAKALLRRHYLGFVFQGYNLLARTTAIENVELPLIYRGLAWRARREKAANALELVGLADRARHTPAELSGGQQQRVAIARAIVTDPLVLLADEPTGNLDTHTGAEIMNLFTQLNRDEGIIVVLITHDREIAAYAHRLVRFRDGIVEHDGAVVAGEAEAPA
jgi:putative ABC transport system ATP-binding protein